MKVPEVLATSWLHVLCSDIHMQCVHVDGSVGPPMEETLKVSRDFGNKAARSANLLAGPMPSDVMAKLEEHQEL